MRHFCYTVGCGGLRFYEYSQMQKHRSGVVVQHLAADPRFAQTATSHLRQVLCIYIVLARFTETEQALLGRLVDTNPIRYFTEFNQLREAPKSATLIHPEDWAIHLYVLHGSDRKHHQKYI